MAQGKVYRNCSNLTTPPAIQGPEVSATWRRTCRGEGQAEKDKQRRSPHDSPDATGHSGL